MKTGSIGKAQAARDKKRMIYGYLQVRKTNNSPLFH